MLRILLFLGTNLAILIVFGLVASLLGVDRYLTGTGLNLPALLVFSALFGFGGAFVSLFISKWMAKRSVGARVIDQPRTATEAWLVDTVRRQAKAAGIGMPEVAIYDSGDVNAFATGWNKNNALVAVSTGLLQHMSQEEAEAVLGHEVSHVANGDMVTMALLTGVLNTFVIFLSRVVGFLVDSALRGRDSERSGPGIGYFVVSIAAQIVFGILASMIVAWFSRRREFRADAGGAALADRSAMVSALRALGRVHGSPALPNEVKAFGIRGDQIANLFSSHPPLEVRIARLEAQRTLESAAGIQLQR
ncbi:MAG TPA: protease HtpX [Polyangiaceae bacterium LLY-WYZ-14_1]|jgi:heat shock protein HtpX|nr:protease HtpX [Polyangiaceae bacterium LLY-WYZ-14_1]